MSRNFTRHYDDGTEEGDYSGNEPRQAALKVARRAIDEPYDSEEEARENSVEISIRERGTDAVRTYEAWSWMVTADNDDPDFLGEEYKESNVSYVPPLTHLDE